MIGNNKQAFSLLELVVSVTIFVIIIMSAMHIFAYTIKAQRSAIASQNVQESNRYFLEVISKEIKMAKKNKGYCPGIPGEEVYKVEQNSLGDVLKFRNYFDECVSYYLYDDGGVQRFVIKRGINPADYISPAKINIDKLQFHLRNNGVHPVVTVNVESHALDQKDSKARIIIQTSLSSRYYRE